MIVDNKFVGSIPTEVGLLTTLYNLNLNRNKFEGSIPSDFGSLTSLASLYLGEWKWIYNTTCCFLSIIVLILFFESCLVFYIGNNKFEGSIPSDFGALTFFEYLALGEWK